MRLAGPSIKPNFTRSARISSAYKSSFSSMKFSRQRQQLRQPHLRTPLIVPCGIIVTPPFLVVGLWQRTVRYAATNLPPVTDDVAVFVEPCHLSAFVLSHEDYHFVVFDPCFEFVGVAFEQHLEKLDLRYRCL